MSNNQQQQQQQNAEIKDEVHVEKEDSSPKQPAGEAFKKPFLKSLNLMKPSLSLTSLPPQSPHEPAHESSSTERPYNSLKKKREGNEQRELWRRSWESQNSVSTTTSHTGTSTKNEFWATYNYLMDNSIIDSCREASGEAKFAGHVGGDVIFKSINNSNLQFHHNNQGSQESSLASDPRRLRRWLREMEDRISKLPSLKEAMKLSANDLTRFTTEITDLYREINSNSRFVAACVRSLEKENAKAIDDQQQQLKSLDYSEHDSLVSTVTTTSTESKRSEKSNALERRYHLLYLRAFEIQCIYEGLLDKRNFLVLSEEFQQASTDSTSDEEPIAKIRKIISHLPSDSKKRNNNCDDDEDELPSELCNNNTNGNNKSNGNHQLEFDGDADFEDSEADEEAKKMECVALKPSIDCVDSIIVPVKQQRTPSPMKSEQQQQKIAVTPKSTGAVKRQKDFSKFNRSNRKSKNCAIFYYKHIDTDNDQVNNEDGKESEPTTISTATSEEEEEEIWEYSNTNGEDIGNNDDDEHAISDDKFQNIVVAAAEDTKLDNCLPRNNDVNDTAKSTTQQLQSQQAISNASNTTTLITKETLQEYVRGAESLVCQKINDQTTKTEYFFNEIVHAKNNQRKQQQQQTQKKLMEKSHKDTAKISRVQEWLKRNQDSNDGSNANVQGVQQHHVYNDGEASGEYTSGSERSSDSSEEITDSVATCLQGIVDPLQTSTEALENNNISPVHKVAMRRKINNRRHSERPWSVSCISQLTGNSRQSLIDVNAKLEETSTTLANFSISESALNQLPKYKTTSESDSKNCNNNKINSSVLAATNSAGSKNSLRRRRVKSRKKSLSSNKKSESGSDVQVLLKSITKSDTFNTSLMEDLSTAISMMTIITNNSNNDNGNQGTAQVQKSDDDDEQVMKPPNFKIGSITNVYGNPMNLGSLAALANYNSTENRANETGTENLSGFSEHNMWDNYIGEKYNSEAYSEDRDLDGARKLLEFGDDYRNFIDSQSDCCSSLSAANQLDSLSPPRHRKNLQHSPQNQQQNASLSSSNENSMKILRQRRIQELPETERRKLGNGEDRKSNILLEKLLKRASEHGDLKNRSQQVAESSSKQQQQQLLLLSSSDDEENESKVIANCKLALEQTQALRMANPQLLRPEDYEEIVRTCLKQIEQLEAILRAGGENPKAIRDLVASWNNLLNWSENAAKARRLQEEIIAQKQLLDAFDVDDESVLNSEEAIREKIHELNNAHDELYKYRSNMLKLNAAVHSWLTRQELNRNQVVEIDGGDLERTTQSDLGTFADDELHKHLKDEIVSLYAKWDSINANISSQLESLKHSLICWTKFEKGLEELRENLSKDRGALNGLKGAIEEGTTSPEELVDNVAQVSKLLSEKLENRIQTISTNEDFMLHPEAALKFIATSSSNGSYQSDSGISDEGFSELSERERRLMALKKIAKQLESALSPNSTVLKTITQRMEAAENELKILQSTCRELILRTSTQLLKQQGIDISSHAQSQINVQIPIITIKNKSKRSLPRRGKKRSSPMASRKSSDLKLSAKSSNDEMSESDMEEPSKVRWSFFKRVARLAVPFQLTILTLFCVACLLEPRCCDTLNNLSMSLTPQLRYIKGPPPT